MKGQGHLFSCSGQLNMYFQISKESFPGNQIFVCPGFGNFVLKGISRNVFLKFLWLNMRFCCESGCVAITCFFKSCSKSDFVQSLLNPDASSHNILKFCIVNISSSTQSNITAILITFPFQLAIRWQTWIACSGGWIQIFVKYGDAFCCQMGNTYAKIVVRP